MGCLVWWCWVGVVLLCVFVAAWCVSSLLLGGVVPAAWWVWCCCVCLSLLGVLAGCCCPCCCPCLVLWWVKGKGNINIKHQYQPKLYPHLQRVGYNANTTERKREIAVNWLVPLCWLLINDNNGLTCLN